MYQFIDFTLQVVYAVELSLSAALGGEAVFAAPSHVVHKFQLLPREDVLLQQLLEVCPAQIHHPFDRERQLDLGTAITAQVNPGSLSHIYQDAKY